MRALRLALPMLAAAAVAAGSAPARGQEGRANALTPEGRPHPVPDARGMTHLRTTRRRTPTGFLYPNPPEPFRLRERFPGLWVAGFLEVGPFFDGGDEDETRFEEYADWSDGLLLSGYRLGLLHTETGLYLDAHGGGTDRNDEFHFLETGILGRLRLRAGFDEVPHVTANDARVLWLGAGGDTLRLPSPLVPGRTDPLALEERVARLGESRLETHRDRTRVGLDWRAFGDLSLFARYGLDTRRGGREFGGSLGFPGQGQLAAVETVEPIDQRTHRLEAGLRLGGERLQANLVYEGSWFRNEEASLTFDVPARLLGTALEDPAVIDRGRFALSPDSVSHRVGGDLAVRLPLDGLLSVSTGWSTWKQDEDLLPPTLSRGRIGFGASELDLSRWNTTAALSRRSAEAEADLLLLHARLRLRPWHRLRLGLRVRYFDREHRTPAYTAFNPLTGEYGFPAEDAALAARTGGFYSGIVSPDPEALFGTDLDLRFRTTAYAFEKVLYEGDAQLRLLGKSSVGFRYRHEEIRRQGREREETREDRFRGTFVSRDLPRATLRLSFESADRSGTRYDARPDPEAYTSSLPGFSPLGGALRPRVLFDFRKPDLASRREKRADARLTLLLRDDLDLGLAAGWRDVDHGADWGVQGELAANVHVDLTWQPSPRLRTWAFGGIEDREWELRSINDTAAFSAQGFAGGLVFPAERAFEERFEERALAFGAGFELRLHERATLASEWRYTSTRETIDWDAATAGATIVPPALGADPLAPVAGSFPEFRTSDQWVTTSLRVELGRGFATRLYHHYRRAEIRDFLQERQGGLVGGGLFLQHHDEGFSAHVWGVTLEWSF